jgi:predicted transcriptional regulator
VGDDVFQLDELVDLYRISSFNDLEETSNFRVVENTFVDVDVDVDVEELYNILKTSRHIQVDEDDDNDEINIEDYNEYDDDEIE